MSVRLTHHTITYLSQGTPNQKRDKRTHQHLETHFLLLWFLPHSTFVETKFPRSFYVAYYPNLICMCFLLKITLISWDKPTCLLRRLKTIFYHCEQLLIRMSSIWESSCWNQIWPRQNSLDIYWISAQIKLFHFVLDFLSVLIKTVLQIISSLKLSSSAIFPLADPVMENKWCQNISLFLPKYFKCN